MKSKKSLQKVLCMVLATASVSSAVVPVSSAEGFFITTEENLKAVVLTKSDKKWENQAPDTKHYYRNDWAIDDLEETNRLRDLTPKWIVVELEWADRSRPNEEILAPTFSEFADKKTVLGICHDLIAESLAKGYRLKAEADWSQPLSSWGDPKKVKATLTPFATYEVNNGLVGLKRDIFQNLTNITKNRAKIRVMLGLCQETGVAWRDHKRTKCILFGMPFGPVSCGRVCVMTTRDVSAKRNLKAVVLTKSNEHWKNQASDTKHYYQNCWACHMVASYNVQVYEKINVVFVELEWADGSRPNEEILAPTSSECADEETVCGICHDLIAEYLAKGYTLSSHGWRVCSSRLSECSEISKINKIKVTLTPPQ
ncbi:hypothetical protein FACS189481_3190 [Clostridia bacterium]|nr:hypothetical protein FACS189481_3190 [Clostridia bacterium]